MMYLDGPPRLMALLRGHMDWGHELNILASDILNAIADGAKEIIKRRTPAGKRQKLQQELQVAKYASPGDVEIVIDFNGDIVALWVEVGTGIHGPTGKPIRATSAKFLHWVDDAGMEHFARQIEGMEGRHMVALSVDEILELLAMTAEKVAVQWFKHLAS